MLSVIDIGSNSVRLMLETPQKLNKKITVTTRLGEGLCAGVLTQESMTRSVKAIAELKITATRAGATEVYVFATEAVRAAKNGADFCDAVYAQTGLTVDVLAPETEAQIGFLGATFGFSGSAAVIDVGGASTEIATGAGGKVEKAASIPVGAVRLKNISDDPAVLRDAVYPLLERLPAPRGKTFAVGGTATALAACDLKLSTYDPERVHGHVLTLDALKNLSEKFMHAETIAKDFPTLGKRAEIILQGAVIYKIIFEYFGLKELSVSETDNCEGYLMLKK